MLNCRRLFSDAARQSVFLSNGTKRVDIHPEGQQMGYCYNFLHGNWRWIRYRTPLCPAERYQSLKMDVEGLRGHLMSRVRILPKNHGVRVTVTGQQH